MGAYIPPPEGGYSTMPEYRVWATVVSRCRASKGTPKEIEINTRWLVFTNFLFDLGRRPSDKHRLRRYELDKGFIAGNVFWSDKPKLTRKDQPERRIWNAIIHKCDHPKGVYYKKIVLCQRWRVSFAAFLADVGYRPSKRHKLIRVDKKSGYAPGNVKWVKNSGDYHPKTKQIKHKGKTKSLAGWGRKLGVKHINSRVKRMGAKRALSTPIRKYQTAYEMDGETHSLKEWAEKFGRSRNLVSLRLFRGWTLKEALTIPPQEKVDRRAESRA